MKKEIIEEYFIQNGIVINKNSKKISFEKVDNIIFEVIRVMKGVPLFFEEHIERLTKSAKLLNYDISKLLDDLTMDTKKIIDINNNPERNLKILVYNLNNPIPDYYLFFIESNYPQEELYKTGIETITFKAIRDNPNAKVINNDFRKNVNTSIEKNNAYEALLLNEANEITEGSRSNLFFVKNNSVYTSPRKDVLLGTTRNKIITICNELGIEIFEEPIPLNFLKECNALFITGTSPKVLPISKVDDLIFNSTKNEIVQKITAAYDSLLEEYINSRIIK